MFCKVLNNRLIEHFDKGGVLHKVQADIINNIYCIALIFHRSKFLRIAVLKDFTEIFQGCVLPIGVTAQGLKFYHT